MFGMFHTPYRLHLLFNVYDHNCVGYRICNVNTEWCQQFYQYNRTITIVDCCPVVLVVLLIAFIMCTLFLVFILLLI